MLSSLSAVLPFETPDSSSDCLCSVTFDTHPTSADARDADLVVDATDCPGGGDLEAAPACRATVVSALRDRDAGVVRTRDAGVERTYDGTAAALLLAAGRFAERVAVYDDALATRTLRDPLGAAHEATGRAGPVSTVAAESGLAELAARVAGYADALCPVVGPTVARSRVSLRPPADATLRDARTLDTGTTVRRYETPAGPRYHLRPVAHTLGADALATLAAAWDRLASGAVSGGERAPGRAVRRVATDDTDVETLTRVLRSFTRGHGVLDDFFSDPQVSDVYATAPVDDGPVRVVVDGESMPTNVRLTPDGAATLASRFRRQSGRAFSRASPTLDAVVDAPDGSRVRVAGVTDPVSEGTGFAFRSHGGATLTLPALVENDTISASAAALLSVAVERAAAVLVAGPRGAGKTTLLGSLLFELPPSTRSVLIEDTPELPVAALTDVGRDVQTLRTESGDGPALDPDDALQTALRLGDGALVVGEVRGAEAATLYEAMRVGATGGAVLGTIHGTGAAAVRERVVADLGVSASSFAATDLVVTLAGDGSRRVASIEEVRRSDDGVRFASLFSLGAEGLNATGTLARGDSRLLAALAEPAETYADVLDRLDERETLLATLATTDRTRPTDRDAAAREGSA